MEDGELVAGPWGDLSPDLHKLLLVFAESRVAAMSRAQGWEAGPGQLGKVNDGGGEASLEHHCGPRKRLVPAGETVTAWTRCRGGS